MYSGAFKRIEGICFFCFACHQFSFPSLPLLSLGGPLVTLYPAKTINCKRDDGLYLTFSNGEPFFYTHIFLLATRFPRAERSLFQANQTGQATLMQNGKSVLTKSYVLPGAAS
jgi:hypothetical protein